MLDKIKLGDYYYTNSIIHKLNPISKLICTFIFFLMVISSFHIETSLILLILVLTLILISKVPLTVYYNVFKKLSYFILIILILSLIVTVLGFNGMAFFINICLFLLYFVFLLTTTSFTDLLYGFETILLPFENCNVDCKKAAFNITLGIKNICYFINNIDIITGNLLFDFKVILKNKKRKQKELNRVLKIRNFNLSKERTYRVKHKWHFFDIISIIVYLIIWLLLSIGGILL